MEIPKARKLKALEELQAQEAADGVDAGRVDAEGRGCAKRTSDAHLAESCDLGDRERPLRVMLSGAAI